MILLRFYAKIDHFWTWQIENTLGNYTKPEKIPFTYFLGFFPGLFSKIFIGPRKIKRTKKSPPYKIRLIEDSRPWSRASSLMRGSTVIQ